MENITIVELLSAYLPYGVNVLTPNGIGLLERVKLSHSYVGYKLILKDINTISSTEIRECGFFTKTEFKQSLLEGELNYSSIRYLLRKKYDIFNAINTGMAVDLNSILVR